MTTVVNPKTAVLLCQDLETLGRGLDLTEIRQWLEQTMPGAYVQTLANPGNGPGEVSTVVADGGAAHLVLGLCSGDYQTVETQAQARKAGLDPLGVEVVNLGAFAALSHPRPQATERAKILLAAAVSRARAFPGSSPQNMKPHLPARISRRSLFSLSFLEYRPVPSVLGNRCAAGSGCQVCAQECPCQAIQRVNGHVRVDKLSCEGCGVCLTACPRGAIQFPAHAPTQVAAQITTLLNPAVGTLSPRGILFTCPRSALVLEKTVKGGRIGALESGVEMFPVQLPCLGMAPPTWFLECLNLGATAVRLAPCPGRCSLNQQETIKGRVAYCREVLRSLGASPERVQLQPAPSLQFDGPHHVGSPAHGTWNSSPALVIQRLAQDHQAPDGLRCIHRHSPFGVIEATRDCTGCGVCAEACPAGALTLDRQDGCVELAFDAALCTACDQCVPRCPEAALVLQRVTDLERLLQGRVSIYQDEIRRCENCSAPIASLAMFGRMKTLLGEENAPALAVAERYCPDCRGWLR